MASEEPDTVAAKPSVFVLGPFLTNVIEPMPGAPAPAVATPGRRQIVFDTPETSPGGIVNLKLVPPANPADVAPLNVYAFFVQPVSSVPADPAVRTPDWFFRSGAASGSNHIGAADPTTGAFSVTATGVKPSLDPYHVQTVLEFPGT